jgi:hypothetical protein
MQRKVFIPSGLTVNHPFFYIIKHTPSGKYYVGYCAKKRYCNSQKLMCEDGYKTSSKIVKDIIDKDGLGSFTICKVRHYANKESALGQEVKFLKRVNAMRNPKFLNQTNGDKKFIMKYVTDEHRRKNSESQKGKIMSTESRMKMSKWQTGRTLSKSHIENMKKAQAGKILSQDHKKKIGDRHRGKFVSDETRQKLAMSNKGKIHTEETKRKMTESRKGKKASEETKQKMRESALLREGRKRSNNLPTVDFNSQII